MQEFERVEHRAGSHIPISWPLFTAAVVGVSIDELIQAERDLFYTPVAAVFISIHE